MSTETLTFFKNKDSTGTSVFLPNLLVERRLESEIYLYKWMTALPIFSDHKTKYADPQLSSGWKTMCYMQRQLSSKEDKFGIRRNALGGKPTRSSRFLGGCFFTPVGFEAPPGCQVFPAYNFQVGPVSNPSPCTTRCERPCCSFWPTVPGQRMHYIVIFPSANLQIMYLFFFICLISFVIL